MKMADATRIRRGLLSVKVLNFEDLTDDSVFGGGACEPPPRLQVSLISPELQRWTERGMVPKTIGPGSEAVMQNVGGKIEQWQIVAGVACVGSLLLHLECFSSPPPDEGAEVEKEGELLKPHDTVMCSELLSTEELPDPQVHLWEQERLKKDLQRLVEEKHAQLEEDPKNKALEGEIRQLEVDLDAPIPPPPALEKNVILLFDDGRQAANISISLALALDPEIPALDDSMQGKEAGEPPERTPQCPRPVEEAFSAAVSILDVVISNAVDNWLDYVLQRRTRQYAAAYCLEAACAVLELADLLPVGEPQALAQRAHHKGAVTSRDAHPRSARLPADPSGAAARPPAHPRSLPLAPSIHLVGRPSPWSSPRVASPRGARNPLPSYAHETAALLPYWGYVSEEAVPAPIDNMARGVVPIKMRRTGDMTDSILLEKIIPSAGIGTGQNTQKPAKHFHSPLYIVNIKALIFQDLCQASATSRASSKATLPYVTTHEKKAIEALAALTGAGKAVAGPSAAGRLRPASAPVIRASALAVAAAGARVSGAPAERGGGGAGLVADGIQEAHGTKAPYDDMAKESLKTYRSAQGAPPPPSARIAAKRRPASAAARSSAMAPEAGNVLESQAVVQLFQSRRTLLRCLFDHFLSPSGKGAGGGVAQGKPRDPSPPKVAPKPPPLDQVSGGQERLAVQGALTMAWQLELIPSFVSEQEAAEAFALGKIRALDHATTMHVNLLEFVRGIGRIALCGFSRGEASSKDFSAAADKVIALLRHIDSQHGKILLASQAAKLELEQNPLPYSRLSISPGGSAQADPQAKHPEILAQQSRAQRQHHDAQLEIRRQMQGDKNGARTRPVSASAKIEKIGKIPAQGSEG